jgi:hypothetical protein
MDGRMDGGWMDCRVVVNTHLAVSDSTFPHVPSYL